jgi:hypothetical protein
MRKEDLNNYEIYRNKKNKQLYSFGGMVKNSEPTEDGSIQEMVLYQACYGNYQKWVRPLNLFLEKFEPVE